MRRAAGGAHWSFPPSFISRGSSVRRLHCNSPFLPPPPLMPYSSAVLLTCLHEHRIRNAPSGSRTRSPVELRVQYYGNVRSALEGGPDLQRLPRKFRVEEQELQAVVAATAEGGRQIRASFRRVWSSFLSRTAALAVASVFLFASPCPSVCFFRPTSTFPFAWKTQRYVVCALVAFVLGGGFRVRPTFHIHSSWNFGSG